MLDDSGGVCRSCEGADARQMEEDATNVCKDAKRRPDGFSSTWIKACRDCVKFELCELFLGVDWGVIGILMRVDPKEKDIKMMDIASMLAIGWMDG